MNVILSATLATLKRKLVIFSSQMILNNTLIQMEGGSMIQFIFGLIVGAAVALYAVALILFDEEEKEGENNGERVSDQ